jgi:negative regulator of flagellin synthesis FlgM
MTSPINSLASSLYAQTTEARIAAKTEQRTPPSPIPVQSTDRNEVGEASRQALASSDFDAAKVESIRKAIADGQYAIDPKRIAESFMALEAMLGPVGRSSAE